VDLLYDPPGHSRHRRCAWSAIFFSLWAPSRLVLRVRRGRLADGPAATALHDVDLTWLVVRWSQVSYTRDRCEQSSLFSKTYKQL